MQVNDALHDRRGHDTGRDGGAILPVTIFTGSAKWARGAHFS
jgi:hypothetical protein